jgi:hypothetical protein
VLQDFGIQVLRIEYGSIREWFSLILNRWEDDMENWKKAVIAGSAAAATVMVVKGRHSAGLLLAGVSLAALASEYPQEFARFRKRLPNYIDRGVNFVESASRLGERLAESTGERGVEWVEALLRG